MKKKYRRILYKVDLIVGILAIIGLLNWGLVGFFNYNLVQDILPMLAKYIYMLVGLTGVWIILRNKKFMSK